jgi:hypothetical protein
MTYKFQMNHWMEPLETGATEAVIGGTAGYLGWSTGSGDWGSSDWNFYDTGTVEAYEVQYGVDADDSAIWFAVVSGASKGGRVAHDDLPTQTSDWTSVDVVNSTILPQGVSNGLPNDDTKASWCVAARDGRFSYNLSGAPETSSNWTKLGSGNMPGHLTDVTFNQNTSGSPVWVRSNSRSQLDSSVDGINWTTRKAGIDSDSPTSRIGYGNDVWIAIGNGADPAHFIAGASGQTWNALNSPASGRVMNGLDSDRSGNWCIVGDDGYVWYSSDDGSNWTEVRIVDSRGAGNHSNVLDVAYDGAGIWIAVGADSEMWKSTDNGANWSSITPSRGSNGDLQSIEFNILA